MSKKTWKDDVMFRWPRAWLVIDKRRRSFRVQLYGRKPKQSEHRKVFAMSVYVGPRVRLHAVAAKGRKR